MNISGRNTPQRRIDALLVLAAILVSVTGCATIPRERAADWTVLLPAGCAAYFSLNLSPDTREVVEAVLGRVVSPGFDSNTALERTDRIYGALKVSPEDGAALYAAADGRFPKAALRYALSHSDDWTTVKLAGSGGLPRRRSRSEELWINRRTPMQVYLTRDGVLLLATEDLRSMIDLYRISARAAVPARLPEVVLQGMDGSDMLVFFPALGRSPLLRSFDTSLPAGDAWIEFVRDEAGYALQGHFVLLDGVSGRRFTNLLKLLLLYVLKGSEIEGYTKRLMKLEFLQEGDLLRVSGLTLSADELMRVIAKTLAGTEIR